VKRVLLEQLRPVCPRCLRAGAEASVLEPAPVTDERDGDIITGSLSCPAPDCRQEYPIIDGIAVLVPDVRGWVQVHHADLLARRDLDPGTESLLGDCLDPAGPFNQSRHHISIYAADHYGIDGAADGAAQGASVHDLLRAGLDTLVPRPDGPVLDLGCSVGGTTLRLGALFPDRPVLGMDLSWGMLRLGREALTDGRITVSLKEVGLVYRRMRHDVADAHGPLVDFWIGDALWPPFAPATFGTVVALNLLDCVQSPVQALASIDRILTPQGRCLMATPYDWSVGATPIEGWIGGHSQRAPDMGLPEARMGAILHGGSHPLPALRLRMQQCQTRSWRVRLSARASLDYMTDLMTLAVDDPA